MWFVSTFTLLTTIISVVVNLPSSNGYVLGGVQNGFGCCMTPCSTKSPSCECPCGFPLPQLPLLLPQPLPLPTLFPPYPANPSGGYATYDNSKAQRQNHLQQPNTYRTSPYQKQPSGQFAGAYGYNVNQIEQPNGGSGNGYATGPYSVGNNNGDYSSSSYSLPHGAQPDARYGALQPQQPVPATGQFIPGSSFGHDQQSDNPIAVTVGTARNEYDMSPLIDENEQKNRAFLKTRKSQMA